MFKFVVFLATVAVSSAHNIPTSYQNFIMYHPAPAHHEHSKTEWAPPVAEAWTEKPKIEWAHSWEAKEQAWEPKEKSKVEYHLTEKPKSEETRWGYKEHSWEPKEHSWEPKEQSWEHKSQWDHKEHSWEPKEHSWEHKEEEKPSNYDFKYEVHDEKTGDIKRQSETASNGVVKGQYSLIDADGFRRVVEYTADDNHGFQATVKREPTHFKIPEPEKKEEEPKNEHWW